MILVGVEFFDRLDKDNLPPSICEFGLAKAGIPPHKQLTMCGLQGLTDKNQWYQVMAMEGERGREMLQLQFTITA